VEELSRNVRCWGGERGSFFLTQHGTIYFLKKIGTNTPLTPGGVRVPHIDIAYLLMYMNYKTKRFNIFELQTQV
jgi:hypothetical protein